MGPGEKSLRFKAWGSGQGFHRTCISASRHVSCLRKLPQSPTTQLSLATSSSIFAICAFSAGNLETMPYKTLKPKLLNANSYTNMWDPRKPNTSYVIQNVPQLLVCCKVLPGLHKGHDAAPCDLRYLPYLRDAVLCATVLGSLGAQDAVPILLIHGPKCEAHKP